MAEAGYRQLDVWHVSMDMAEAIYNLTRAFPDTEKFGLVVQLRRAAVSIPSNIAEGHSREHRGDYLRLLSIARGSLAEVETQLQLAVRLNYINRDDAKPTWEMSQRVGSMLTRLMQSLRQ